MAVPDWPQTFGDNMFLYPLTGAATNIFLEHSHRLFGTLVGLATLALMGWTLAVEDRRWVKVWAIAIFAFICFQGVLGGSRVLADSRVMAMIHGISAQVILAGIVALATFLSPAFRAAAEAPDGSVLPKRFRVVATASLHAVLLQLVFGALYRHTRSNHALWTHAAFALLVLAAVAVAGFAVMSARRAISDGPRAPLARALTTSGWWLIAVVAVQFLLGWVAFFVGGRERESASVAQALIRTAHQANGALLLTVATAAAVMAKRLAWVPRAGRSPAGP
jgi:cytochrome c oxidase assembly protein subunit 15